MPLLVLRLFLINDIDPALAADDLIIGADFLDASTHFHADHHSLKAW